MSSGHGCEPVRDRPSRSEPHGLTPVAPNESCLVHPELFTIPFLNFSVHSYGLMLVLGLLLAMEVAKFLARRSGLNPDFFSTAAILALISGLIGARIAYVIQFHDQFTHGSFSENFWSAINLTSGGLVYYGGFLLAFPTLVAYAIWRKIPLLRGMDIVAPCLMIGLAFGRVGCFLNGCCWGQHCELERPVGITFPYYSPPYIADYENGDIKPDPRLFTLDYTDNTVRLLKPEEIAARHPELQEVADKERSLLVINTQLISTVTASIIAIVTFLFFTLYRTPGRGFALMMVMEGLTRFLIEGLRVEPTVGSKLTLSMWIGLFVAVGGVVLWFVAGALRNKPLIGETPGYPEPVAT